MNRINETCTKYVFLFCACASILCVALICLFLFANGLPAIAEIGPLNFLLGARWKPGNDIYGIAPMIVGSLYVTAGAILAGAPLGILTAVHMAEFAPRSVNRALRPAISLMAGIPSTIYGSFGLVVPAPLVQALLEGGKRDDRFHSAGHYDFAHHCQRFRIRHTGGAGQLIRGRSCPGGQP